MMKAYSILFILILLNINCFGQFTKTEKVNIIYSLKAELDDSTTILTRTEGEINSMINLMEINLVKDSLFPNQEFDSVVYSLFESHKKPDKIIYTKSIDKNQTIEFLRLINNPLNFKWGECGTPITEAKLEFLKNGVIIASVSFACSHGQLFCEPKNEMIRWGYLNEKGNEILDKIGLWR